MKQIVFLCFLLGIFSKFNEGIYAENLKENGVKSPFGVVDMGIDILGLHIEINNITNKMCDYKTIAQGNLFRGMIDYINTTEIAITKKGYLIEELIIKSAPSAKNISECKDIISSGISRASNSATDGIIKCYYEDLSLVNAEINDMKKKGAKLHDRLDERRNIFREEVIGNIASYRKEVNVYVDRDFHGALSVSEMVCHSRVEQKWTASLETLQKKAGACVLSRK